VRLATQGHGGVPRGAVSLCGLWRRGARSRPALLGGRRLVLQLEHALAVHERHLAARALLLRLLHCGRGLDGRAAVCSLR
jgi:hypothetical protein